MTHEEWLFNRRVTAVNTAKRMLEGSVDLIEGVRSLAEFQKEMDRSNEDDFLIFKAVASETDSWPVGAVRSAWSEAALLEHDAERQEYENEVRASVFEACIRFIGKYGG